MDELRGTVGEIRRLQHQRALLAVQREQFGNARQDADAQQTRKRHRGPELLDEERELVERRRLRRQHREHFIMQGAISLDERA